MDYSDTADSLWNDLQKKQQTETADTLWNDAQLVRAGDTADSLFADLQSQRKNSAQKYGPYAGGIGRPDLPPAVEAWNLRPDSTVKGPGYFGTLKTPSGKDATELSIGVEFDGRETQIPSLVPTLTKEERDWMLAGNEPTDAIVDKAVEHAKKRWAAGVDAFATESDTPTRSKTASPSVLEKAEAAGAQPGSGYYQVAKAVDLITNPEAHRTWLSSPQAKARYDESVSKLKKDYTGTAADPRGQAPQQAEIGKSPYPAYPYADWMRERAGGVDNGSTLNQIKNDALSLAARGVESAVGKIRGLAEGGELERKKSREILRGTILAPELKKFKDIPLDEGGDIGSMSADKSAVGFLDSLKGHIDNYAEEMYRKGLPDSEIKQRVFGLAQIAVELPQYVLTGNLLGHANLAIHSFLAAKGEGASTKEATTAGMRGWAFDRLLSASKKVFDKIGGVEKIEPLEKQLGRIKSVYGGTVAPEVNEALEKQAIQYLKKARDISIPHYVELVNRIAPGIGFAIGGTGMDVLSDEEVTPENIAGYFLTGMILPSGMKAKKRLSRLKSGLDFERQYNRLRRLQNEELSKEAMKNVVSYDVVNKRGRELLDEIEAEKAAEKQKIDAEEMKARYPDLDPKYREARDRELSEEAMRNVVAYDVVDTHGRKMMNGVRANEMLREHPEFAEILGRTPEPTSDELMLSVANRGIKKPGEKKPIPKPPVFAEKSDAHGMLSSLEEIARPLYVATQNAVIDTRTGQIVQRLGTERDPGRPLKSGQAAVSMSGDGTLDVYDSGGKLRMNNAEIKDLLESKMGAARPKPPVPEGPLDISDVGGGEKEFGKFKKETLDRDVDVDAEIEKQASMVVKEDKFELKSAEEKIETEARAQREADVGAPEESDIEIFTPETQKRIDQDYNPGSQKYRDYVDSTDELRRMAKYMSDHGLEVDTAKHPYFVAALARGNAGKAYGWVTNGIRRNGQLVARGPVAILNEYARESDMKGRDFERASNLFLIHTRVLQDLQRDVEVKGEGPKQIARETQVREAEEWLGDFQARHPKEYSRMERLSQEVYGFGRELLVELRDAGIINETQMQDILAKNPHWVPFDRIFPSGVNVKYLEKLLKRGVIKKKQYRAVIDENGGIDELYKLREKKVITPSQYKEAIEMGVGPMVGDRSKSFVGKSLKLIKGSEKDVKNVWETLIGKAYQVSREADRNRLLLAISELSKSFPEEVRPADPKITNKAKVSQETVDRALGTTPVTVRRLRVYSDAGPGNVLMYRDGKPEVYEFSKPIQDAIDMVPPPAHGIARKIVYALTNTLRVSATSMPDFAVRNTIRDTIGSFIQVGSEGKKFGMIPFIDSFRGMFEIMGRGDMYYEWLADGGGLSGFVELNAGNMKRTLKRLRTPYGKSAIERAMKQTGGGILHPVRSLQSFSSLMEQATRLGVYMRGRSAGLTGKEAAFASRGSSVDFARSGLKGRELNRMIAFFNAGIQGTDRFARAMKERPLATTLKSMMAVTLPEIFFYALNRKNEKYSEYPDWMKRTFWMMPVGDMHMKIPKPFIYGQLFGTMFERIFRYIDSKDPMAMDGFVGDIVDAISPVGASGFEAGIPTGILPWLENIVNYNFFLERNIVSPYSLDKMPKNQYNRYSSRTLIALGKLLNMSPAKIENIVRGYFASIGDYALRGADALLAEAGIGEQRRPGNLGTYPFTRSFFTRTGVEISKTQSIFYDSLKIVKRKYDDVKSGGFRSNDSDFWIDANKMYGETHRALSELSKLEDEIISDKSMTPEQKMLEMDKVTLEKEALILEALRVFKRKPVMFRIPETIRNFL